MYRHTLTNHFTELFYAKMTLTGGPDSPEGPCGPRSPGGPR